MTHRMQYNPYVHVSTQYALLVKRPRHDPSDVPLLKVPLSLTPIQATVVARRRPASTPDRRRDYAGMRERLRAMAPTFRAARAQSKRGDLIPLRNWPVDFRASSEANRRAASHRRRRRDRCAVRAACSGRRVRQDWLEPGGLGRGTDHAAGVADALHARGRPGHQRQRPGALRVADAGADGRAVRAGNAAPVRALSPSTVVIWKELACSPCVSVFNHRLSPCRNNVCMQSITVDETFAAVRPRTARWSERCGLTLPLTMARRPVAAAYGAVSVDRSAPPWPPD